MPLPRRKTNSVDVYAYGMLAASTLHLLSQPFPASEGYGEIRATHAMTGGEALNSSLVLSRLGLRNRLDGNWIGDNPGGKSLLGILRKTSIDVSRLRVKKGYTGAEEVVFSDAAGRTIFGNYIRINSTTRQWNIPKLRDVAGARAANIDPFFGKESEQAARYAVRLGIPFVTVDCAPESYLAIHAAVNVVSEEYREREFRGRERRALFADYQRLAEGLTVFTSGGGEILYGRRGQPAGTARAFRIDPVDTTGAGDAFRAGMVMGVYRGWPDAECIRYASALAALVCLSLPGVIHSPTRRQVEEFLASHGKEQ
jgi:sugar/nucleoside kinase (ribokinase family)